MKHDHRKRLTELIFLVKKHNKGAYHQRVGEKKISSSQGCKYSIDEDCERNHDVIPRNKEKHRCLICACIHVGWVAFLYVGQGHIHVPIAKNKPYKSVIIMCGDCADCCGNDENNKGIKQWLTRLKHC